MFSKIVKYYRALSLEDFIRKILFYIIGPRRQRIVSRIRAKLFFKNSSVFMGKNVRIHGLPMRIKIGAYTEFYDNCIFEFGNGDVTIGDHVTFSYGVIFSCRHKIEIGNDVQVGEYTSIRDTTHDHSLTGKSMKYNDDINAAVCIGNDIWIGRNCVIMPGTIIEDGVVIGANSLVKGILKKNGIYGGTPAVLIKDRNVSRKDQNQF